MTNLSLYFILFRFVKDLHVFQHYFGEGEGGVWFQVFKFVGELFRVLRATPPPSLTMDSNVKR